MNASIFIVSCGKHFHWLKYCLRSIEKYACGFHEVVLMVPEKEDALATANLACGYRGKVPLNVSSFNEMEGHGMMHHEALIVEADRHCQGADFILHTDSDCLFCSPVRPEDYFVVNNPVLCYASYPWIVAHFKNPAYLHWKAAVENAIGGVSPNEFMRRHPAVHCREVYQKTRELIQAHTGRYFMDYILSTREEFPHEFAEFPTLGEVAWRHFHDRYFWINQERDPWPKDKLIQFWGHGAMDKPQDVWWGGELHTVIPNQKIKEILK